MSVVGDMYVSMVASNIGKAWEQLESAPMATRDSGVSDVDSRRMIASMIQGVRRLVFEPSVSNSSCSSMFTITFVMIFPRSGGMCCDLGEERTMRRVGPVQGDVKFPSYEASRTAHMEHITAEGSLVS